MSEYILNTNVSYLIQSLATQVYYTVFSPAIYKDWRFTVADVEQVKFVLRLPPSLHRKIKRAAKSNNTSMNKEISNILNESFSKSTTDKTLADLIRRLEKKKVI